MKPDKTNQFNNSAESDSLIQSYPSVSLFQSVADKCPETISISAAFDIIKSGQLSEKIQKLREAGTKAEKEIIKKSLPAITTSGVFNGGHSKDDLVKHSGLLQIDFDSIPDPDELKARLISDQYTFACFISPSGTGVKAIVRISDQAHLECFNGISLYYTEHFGVSPDKQCKDVCRLMFLSSETELFVNERSTVINPALLEVERIILRLEAAKQDITNGYDNWVKIGFALSDSFGEDGRRFFHRVSLFHSGYTEQGADDQYDKCLKSNGGGITIKTFFKIAKGGSLNEELATNKIPRPEKQKTSNETSKFVIVEKYLNEYFEFRNNEVSNEIEFRKKGSDAFEELNENNLYRNMQHQNISFSMNNLMSLLRSDFIPKFNPIQSYFDSLSEWDRATDHISNLCTFIKVKDQERFDRHFKKMLVRCVACSLGASFNKQAFIFMGEQSGGKTTFCRWLCPSELQKYYTENISTDKDSLISLAENFIINLDELATMQRFELNMLKSMLSKDSVKARRPYDKKPSIAKRRANFFGSTNKDEFLSDETGSVRWLCFSLEEIIWAYKTSIDINAVWSQAYAHFKDGFSYNITADEIEENERINTAHQILTPEMELLQTYFEPSEKGKPLAEPLTATDIIDKLRAVGISHIRLSTTNMGKALKMLGFTRVSERIGESKMPKKIYWVRFNPTPTTSTTTE
jgi:hypothetical protein